MAGGGLAGLISAICLQRAGIPVTVVEKKIYPFHRVCGEYISNEVVPFLKRMDLYPSDYAPAQINKLHLTSTSGQSASMLLDMGGFGISRYALDEFLYQKALSAGVEFILAKQVSEIKFENELFTAKIEGHSELHAGVVIGAFGKRSRLDKSLNRPFINKRSPYIGVKYHIRYDHPSDVIALHNFKDGYCGISMIENNRYNLCYLSARSNLSASENIDEMERQILSKNPHLRDIFANADFLFDKPEVINEISFETKAPVEQHILMCGDAAGMITPLCGNGMAMAIRAAKIVSEEVISYYNEHQSRQLMEDNYTQRWKASFQTRLWSGRQIQRLFGSVWASELAVGLAKNVGSVANYLVRQTHGESF